MSSRSLVGRALRAKPSVWEQPASCIAQQHRSFSQTPAPQKNEIVFDKTSNTNLNAILREIQTQIILPYHLSSHQRKRIFLDKYKAGLRRDPVYIEVDGYEHRFEHIDVTKLPASRPITWRALREMETQEDWANLGRLLAGMKRAGRQYHPQDFIKMIRLAGTKGQIYTIIDAARQVRKTDFHLDTSEKVNEVLHFVQARAIFSDFDEEKTAQALRWTEIIIEMLEDEGHLPKRDPRASVRRLRMRWPLYEDPQILGAALHLSAVRAVKHNGGKDVDGKVAHWAKMIADRWMPGKGLRMLHPKGAYDNWSSGVAYLNNSRTQYLSYAAPIMHGMLLATRVLDEPLAAKIQAIANGLGQEVEKEVQNPDYPARRGMATYEALFNKAVQQEQPEQSEQSEQSE